MFTLSSQFIHL
jgi:hypothetical protein